MLQRMKDSKWKKKMFFWILRKKKYRLRRIKYFIKLAYQHTQSQQAAISELIEIQVISATRKKKVSDSAFLWKGWKEQGKRLKVIIRRSSCHGQYIIWEYKTWIKLCCCSCHGKGCFALQFKGKLTQTEIDKLFRVHPQAYQRQSKKLMHLFRLQLAQNIIRI